MRNLLFTTAAVLVMSASAAVAGGPPPHAGGPGGPGKSGSQSFDAWGDGSVMSGSANEFGFSADWRDAGAFSGGVTATGWNQGAANVSAGFSKEGFTAHADSQNFGGM